MRSISSFIALILMIGFTSIGTIHAQSFTEITPANLDLGGTLGGGFTFGDFNGDGLLDAAIGNHSGTGQLFIRLQGVGGTFTPNGTLTNGDGRVRQVAAGDMDNDGDLDLLVSTGGGANLHIYANDGAGNFSLWQQGGSAVGGRPALTGFNSTEYATWIDADGDGDLDIIADNNSNILLFDNDGTGIFSLVPALTSGFTASGGFGDYGATVDFNNDGFVDVAIRRDGTASNPAQADIYQSNGDGSYTPFYGLNFDADNSNKGGVVWADFDNDGDFDALWTDYSTTSNATVLVEQTGTGSGNFSVAAVTIVNDGGGLSALPNSGNIDGVTQGDVNHDGLVDLFLTNDNGTSFMLLNTSTGAGNFSFSSDNLGINVNADGEAAEFIDIDNDGDLDLYVAVTGGANQLWINSFANTDYLDVEVLFDNTTTGGNGTRPALGATVYLTDCAGNVLSGIREVNGASGHGSQNASLIKFGLPSGSSEFYRVVISFVDDLGGAPRTIVFRNVVPNTLPNQKLTVTNSTPSDPANFVTISNSVPSNPTTIGGTDGSITLEGLLANTPYVIDYLDDAVPVNVTITSDASGNVVIAGLNAGSYTQIIASFSPVCQSTPPITEVLVDPNTPPIAVSDFDTAAESTPLVVDVLDLGTPDSDAESNILITSAGSTPGSNNGATTGGGTISINNNGTAADSTDDFIDYIPLTGYEGNDTFYYVITDAGGLTDTAQVVIYVIPEGCLDILPPGCPTAALTSGQITFYIDNPGPNNSTKRFDSLEVVGEPNPFTNLLTPDFVTYSYSNPTASNQQMIENGIDGANITDGPLIFDPALIAANTDRNLNHYFRNDGAIVNTDYVNFLFNYNINTARNRYVVVTERGGNNTMEIQAIDGAGNTIGTAQPIIRVGQPGQTYINTGIPHDNGQTIHITVYPLTAFACVGTAIRGVRLTQTGAPAAPSSGDGGDGKIFIAYDPAFLVPPPTIDGGAVTVTQPTCPSTPVVLL
ncbi:MAG: FG-GAP-like repeat-containing protein [Chitinophagales bacterium]